MRHLFLVTQIGCLIMEIRAGFIVDIAVTTKIENRRQMILLPSAFMIKMMLLWTRITGTVGVAEHLISIRLTNTGIMVSKILEGFGRTAGKVLKSQHSTATEIGLADEAGLEDSVFPSEVSPGISCKFAVEFIGRFLSIRIAVCSIVR